MSSSAGRVLQIFKGDYSGSVQYDPLDCVLYQGSTYVCKATTQGNAPTNTTYWQLQAQGVSNAAGLSYSNSTSGLTATNVQAAIDEEATKMNKTSAAKTGSGTTVTNTIAANTSLDDAVGTLLNNDVALNTALAYFLGSKAVDFAVVNNVNVTISNGFGHASFTRPTKTGYYEIGAFVERVDQGSYDVVAFADPFRARLSIACPTTLSGQLTFNVVIVYAKAAS